MNANLAALARRFADTVAADAAAGFAARRRCATPAQHQLVAMRALRDPTLMRDLFDRVCAEPEIANCYQLAGGAR